MVEWYVIMHGYASTWQAKEVVLGRILALQKLVEGFRLTRDEHKRLGVFLEGGLCNLGGGLHIVGYEKADGERVLDRKLVRVIGPGTEV